MNCSQNAAITTRGPVVLAKPAQVIQMSTAKSEFATTVMKAVTLFQHTQRILFIMNKLGTGQNVHV